MDPEILKRLDALAEKLGATGAHLWDAAVRYQVGCAWGAIIGAVVSVAVLSGYVRWIMASKDRRYEVADGHVGYGMVLLTLAIAAFIACVNAVCVVPTFISPEGAALKSLLGK